MAARIGRSLDATYLDLVRGYHDTEEFARAMRKARSGSDCSSPEPRTGMSCGVSGCEGLENVNGKALLIAAGQNVKRLLSWCGWGQCPVPNGAAGVVLSTLPPCQA